MESTTPAGNETKVHHIHSDELPVSENPERSKAARNGTKEIDYHSGRINVEEGTTSMGGEKDKDNSSKHDSGEPRCPRRECRTLERFTLIAFKVVRHEDRPMT